MLENQPLNNEPVSNEEQATDTEQNVYKGVDERKTGIEEVRAEAQKMADAIVAKKLKGMPSKEEVQEYRAWKEAQKTETEKMAEAQANLAERLRQAEAREAEAEARISASAQGFKAEYIEDAVLLAKNKVTETYTIEQALQDIAQKNPNWKVGISLPNQGSNPAQDEKEATFEIKRHF